MNQPSPSPSTQPADASRPLGADAGLVRRIGLFDATLVVIGGIVGAGIFRNPHVVATEVHTPALILGAWLLGGLIALAGAFIYAELTAGRAAVGGQYAYLKEAYHPALAFVYGWALLLVTQTGGMAAVSVTFADYFLRLLELVKADNALAVLHRVTDVLGLGPTKVVAAVALASLTIVNSLGVRMGATVQSILTILKMVAIAGLVACGFFLASPAPASAFRQPADAGWLNPVTHFGAAMVPVLFAYGGWQTACFIGGEVKNPKRNLPLGLLLGVTGVIILYTSVNWVCLGSLGPDMLSQTNTPAADVARLALGAKGSFLISAGIVISTLGFLSQGMLTAPRVYFAMAQDGLFFRSLAQVHPVTRVPIAAIALQGVMAIVIALSGRYEQILNYVVSVDFIFFGLTAACILIFRKRDSQAGADSGSFRMPCHRWITVFFSCSCWLVVVNSVYAQPVNSLIGLALMLTGIPVYWFWKGRRRLAGEAGNLA